MSSNHSEFIVYMPLAIVINETVMYDLTVLKMMIILTKCFVLFCISVVSVLSEL